MNKSHTFRFVLTLSLFVFAMNFGYSQTSSPNEIGTTKSEKETIFEYKDTPEYVFIDRKNFMKDLNEVQLEILDTYDYPKFISSNDKYQIEMDIKLHWEDVARWEAENAEHIEEILDALGLRK